VVSYVNKQGGTRSRSLWEETQVLFQTVQTLEFSLLARHIPGKLYVIAVQLSRAGHIFRWSGPSQCPTFVSPVPDPLALDVDALSLSWGGINRLCLSPQTKFSPKYSKVQRDPEVLTDSHSTPVATSGLVSCTSGVNTEKSF